MDFRGVAIFGVWLGFAIMVIGLVMFGDMTFSGVAIFLFAGVFLTLIIAYAKPKTEREDIELIIGEVSKLKDDVASMNRKIEEIKKLLEE